MRQFTKAPLYSIQGTYLYLLASITHICYPIIRLLTRFAYAGIFYKPLDHVPIRPLTVPKRSTTELTATNPIRTQAPDIRNMSRSLSLPPPPPWPKDVFTAAGIPKEPPPHLWPAGMLPVTKYNELHGLDPKNRNRLSKQYVQENISLFVDRDYGKADWHLIQTLYHFAAEQLPVGIKVGSWPHAVQVYKLLLEVYHGTQRKDLGELTMSEDMAREMALAVEELSKYVGVDVQNEELTTPFHRPATPHEIVSATRILYRILFYTPPEWVEEEDDTDTNDANENDSSDYDNPKTPSPPPRKSAATTTSRLKSESMFPREPSEPVYHCSRLDLSLSAFCLKIIIALIKQLSKRVNYRIRMNGGKPKEEEGILSETRNGNGKPEKPVVKQEKIEVLKQEKIKVGKRTAQRYGGVVNQMKGLTLTPRRPQPAATANRRLPWECNAIPVDTESTRHSPPTVGTPLLTLIILTPDHLIIRHHLSSLPITTKFSWILSELKIRLGIPCAFYLSVGLLQRIPGHKGAAVGTTFKQGYVLHMSSVHVRTEQDWREFVKEVVSNWAPRGAMTGGSTGGSDGEEDEEEIVYLGGRVHYL